MAHPGHYSPVWVWQCRIGWRWHCKQWIPQTRLWSGCPASCSQRGTGESCGGRALGCPLSQEAPCPWTTAWGSGLLSTPSTLLCSWATQLAPGDSHHLPATWCCWLMVSWALEQSLSKGVPNQHCSILRIQTVKLWVTCIRKARSGLRNVCLDVLLPGGWNAFLSQRASC